MPLPRSRLLAVTAVGVLALGLGGCGNGGSVEPGAASSAAASTSASTPTGATAPTPTATTPAADASDVPSGVATLTRLLLTADELPGFDAAWRWSERDTTTDPVRVGACLRFPLTSIGADATVTRRFVPTGDDGEGTAVQVVARFVDDRSADQAMAVLRSAQQRCTTGATTTRVGPIEPVRVARGQAWWYVAVTMPAGAGRGHVNTLGVLRDGLTIELVELDLAGHDDAAAGRSPIVRALVAAARRLP